MAIGIRVPPKVDHREEEEVKVRELTAEQAENEQAIVLKAYACKESSQQKKINLQTDKDPEQTI